MPRLATINPCRPFAPGKVSRTAVVSCRTRVRRPDGQMLQKEAAGTAQAAFYLLLPPRWGKVGMGVPILPRHATSLMTMSSPLTLYDNYTRTVRAFEPLRAGEVGLYT